MKGSRVVALLCIGSALMNNARADATNSTNSTSSDSLTHPTTTPLLEELIKQDEQKDAMIDRDRLKELLE